MSFMTAVGAAPAAQQPAPFAAGDPEQGKPLVQRDCVACHARQMAGDAERIYLRADRRVRTPEQLLAQVAFCNTELGTNYFPDEEAHVAAHLNARYYGFKP
jgi:hypothetical protein